MNVLALTTSSSVASVALVTPSFQIKRDHSIPRAHTEFVNSAIEELLVEANLQLQELDLIALDIGPGSFTGLRVAVNIAKTLMYGLSAPAYTSTSFQLLKTDAPRCLVMINAYKNLLFVQGFENGQEVVGHQVMSPEAVETWTQQIWGSKSFEVSGNGYEAYLDFFSDLFKARTNRNNSRNEPQALLLAKTALLAPPSSWIKDWNLVLPLYLRDSAAEENLRK